MKNLWLITLLLCLSSYSAAASAVPMTITDADAVYGGRLWLPCSLGQCMIDSGSRGNMIAVTNDSTGFVKSGEGAVQTVIGKSKCDIVSTNLNLAGMPLKTVEFRRCAMFPVKNSPMLGISNFATQRFGLYFSIRQFSWVAGPFTEKLKSPKFRPLTNLGGWPLGVTACIRGSKVEAVIDTGTAATLIDKTFFEKNPDFFYEVRSDRGFTLAKLRTGISLDGFQFRRTDVMIIDLKSTFGPTAPIAFIGMNHLMEVNWEFDLSNLTYRLLDFTDQL